MTRTISQKSARETINRLRTDYLDLFKPKLPYSITLPSSLFKYSLIYRENGSLIDLGGGVGLFHAVLAELGMHVYVIDLLDDYWVQKCESPRLTLASSVPRHEYRSKELLSRQLEILSGKGVKFIKEDLTRCNLRDHFEEESIDVVSTYHCLEHLHHSPRFLLESAMVVLKPGGKLVIEVPNAVNLKKRIKVLFGKTNYLPYEEYYRNEKYYGHIREYTVGDLSQLAANLGADKYEIIGKNWYGTLYTTIKSQLIAKALDRVLQLSPGLCGSLFLVLRKPFSLEKAASSPN